MRDGRRRPLAPAHRAAPAAPRRPCRGRVASLIGSRVGSRVGPLVGPLFGACIRHRVDRRHRRAVRLPAHAPARSHPPDPDTDRADTDRPCCRKPAERERHEKRACGRSADAGDDGRGGAKHGSPSGRRWRAPGRRGTCQYTERPPPLPPEGRPYLTAKPLDCIEVQTAEPCDYTVIWLHGLGASGHDFEPVVPALEPAVASRRQVRVPARSRAPHHGQRGRRHARLVRHRLHRFRGARPRCRRHSRVRGGRRGAHRTGRGARGARFARHPRGVLAGRGHRAVRGLRRPAPRRGHPGAFHLPAAPGRGACPASTRRADGCRC